MTEASQTVRRRGLMLVLSVSATTRPPRPGEQAGRDYDFVSHERFREMVAAGAMLEHAEVFGNFYGTPALPVRQSLAAGRDVLFDIDWQGTQQLRQSARSDLASIFILPPAVAELERRLTERAQDSPEVVQKRMAKAGDEMSHWPEYDYIVVNHTLARSVAAVQAILIAERLRRERQVGLVDFVNGLRPPR
jgi:guanylate kinase